LSSRPGSIAAVDAGLGGDDGEDGHLLRALGIERRDRVRRRPPRGEHRFEDEHPRAVERWHLEVVPPGLERVGVALEPDHPHERRRQHVVDAREQAEAGAQDGDRDDGPARDGDGSVTERARDRRGAGWQTLHRAQGEQRTEPLRVLPEVLGGGAAIAERGELHPGDGVVEDGDGGHVEPSVPRRWTPEGRPPVWLA
jgi:hypothetical protein